MKPYTKQSQIGSKWATLVFCDLELLYTYNNLQLSELKYLQCSVEVIANMLEENKATANGCGKIRRGIRNEAALLALMEKTGYSMVQENGQRKFGGPPPGKHFF